MVGFIGRRPGVETGAPPALVRPLSTVTSMATEWSPGAIASGTITGTSMSSTPPGANGSHGTCCASTASPRPTTRTVKRSDCAPSLCTRTVQGTTVPGRASTEPVTASTRNVGRVRDSSDIDHPSDHDFDTGHTDHQFRVDHIHRSRGRENCDDEVFRSGDILEAVAAIGSSGGGQHG